MNDIPLMTPTFFDENDPNNPKRTTYLKKRDVIDFINSKADKLAEERGSLHIGQSMRAFRNLANQIRDLPDEKIDIPVQCINCKFANTSGGTGASCICENTNTPWFNHHTVTVMKATDFCSYGKRKDTTV